jgi:hypothetical protein
MLGRRGDYQYFATVLCDTDVQQYMLPQHVRACPLTWNAEEGALQLERREGELCPDVDVNLQLDESIFFPAVAKLLRCNSPCFKVDAVCAADVSQPPLGYDIYINGGVFEGQMQQRGSVIREAALFAILASAYTSHLLHVRPRRLARQPATQDDVFQWMLTRETGDGDYDDHGDMSVDYPHFIPVQDSNYAYCFRELAFVPRDDIGYLRTTIHGGLVIGARSSGKTRTVGRLIEEGTAAHGGEPCPDFMSAVRATLIVAPVMLVDQWQRELARLDDVCTLTVVDNETWAECCTLPRLRDVDVVLTTPRFLRRQLSAPDNAKHVMRRAKRRRVERPLSLTSLFWHRVVVDEIGTWAED